MANVLMQNAGAVPTTCYFPDGTSATSDSNGVVSVPQAFVNSQFAAGFTIYGDTATDGITAFATGGQASAVKLTTKINRVTTVGTAADSVILPPAKPGMVIKVINAAAANAMNVFPFVGDLINALSANTALSVAANKEIDFVCAIAGKWNTNLTA